MRAHSGKTPLLTVVTPISQMSGRLTKLNSWLDALNENLIHVVLVHDLQDLKTGEELRSMLKLIDNPQIELIEENFGSPGLARNAGLKKATAEWVCFWDSDDMPNVQQFTKMLESVNNSEVSVIVGEFVVKNELDGRKKVHRFSDHFMDDIAQNPGIWRFAFRRPSLASFKFSNLRMAEDQLFLAKYLTSDVILQQFNMPVYEYYIGESFHLTNQIVARRDLIFAAEESLQIMKTLPKVNLRFVSILFSRQVITAIKLGDVNTKIRGFLALIVGVSSFSNRICLGIIKSTLFVIFNKRRLL